MRVTFHGTSIEWPWVLVGHCLNALSNDKEHILSVWPYCSALLYIWSGSCLFSAKRLGWKGAVNSSTRSLVYTSCTNLLQSTRRNDAVFPKGCTTISARVFQLGFHLLIFGVPHETECFLGSFAETDGSSRQQQFPITRFSTRHTLISSTLLSLSFGTLG